MNEYDEIKHIYRINGEHVPSVTQLLPDQIFYCTPEQLENARIEGIMFHEKAKLYFEEKETFNDPELIAIDKLFREHKNLFGELVLFEEPLFSVKMKFGGRPDAIFTKAIIDFKRSIGNRKYHALQLAGYHILVKENKIIKPTKRHFIIYKNSSGQYSVVNVYDDQAEAFFKSCMVKYNMEKIINLYLKS